MTRTDLQKPELFINRELSLLEFNRRVLEQAMDRDVPLLERLRFLSICSTNLDEFFEIRVAGLQQQVEFELDRAEADGLLPAQALRQISQTAQALVEEQYRCLNQEILPELADQGMRLLRRSFWTPKQKRWIKRYFMREVLPVLTPMGIDPSHPFPRVLSKGLCFAINVEGKDAFDRSSGVAVVQVPRSLPRLIRLPTELDGAEHAFVMLSSIIHEFVDELFPGMGVTGCYQFRVTRNSELWVDEEEIDNLLQALKGELPSRKFGEAVRLEVADTCSAEMAAFLLEKTGLCDQDLYRVRGPVNLHRLSAIYEMVERPDLKFRTFVPGTRRRLKNSTDMFAAIRKRDVLLHHPYESLTPVVQLLQQAAEDPSVVAIKQTVYRTDADSPLVEALLDAAIAGKEVTAVIELRARFDEAANIDLATRLQEAGANVVYGIVGYKAHAKMVLIVRKEGDRLRRYVHLGTGNYHPGTARAYTDIGFLTCSRDVGRDVHKVFNQLTGLGKVDRLRSLLQAPFTLHKALIKEIEAETRNAKAGKPARIMARMNSLSEPQIIRSLYEASMAGVSVDLIVRGVCCLRPGVEGISDKIRVRSIVGRFLEHSRVFYFHANGEERVYCSSADWMQRNFFRRLEVCFPISDTRLRSRLINETLELYLADNQQAWELRSDGSYERVEKGKDGPCKVQSVLLTELAEVVGAGRRPSRKSARRSFEGSVELVPLASPRGLRSTPEDLVASEDLEDPDQEGKDAPGSGVSDEKGQGRSSA